MSSGSKGPNASNGVPAEKTYFEQQREALVVEIALVKNPRSPSRSAKPPLQLILANAVCFLMVTRRLTPC